MDDIAAIIVATVILKNIPLLIYQVKKKQQQKQILAFLVINYCECLGSQNQF